MRPISRSAWTACWMLAALAVAFAIPASAATYTWSNSAGGNWSSSANWSPSGVPAAGDAVVLPTLAGAYAVTLDVNASISALTLGSGATLQMASANGLHFTGLSIQNDGVVVIGPASTNVLNLDNTSDTLQVSGSGAIELQGAGSITSPLSRPTLHWRLVNGAGHTIRGDGNIWVPVENRGLLTQTGTGARLLTLNQYLWNSGVVRVSDGGTVNVRYLVGSRGGVIVGHNGWLKVQPTDQPDNYNYGPIDGLQGGLTMVADGGNLDVLAGVVTSAHIIQTGGSGVVGFHNTGNPNNLVVTPGAELLLDGGTNYHTDLSSIENHGIVHVMGTLSVGTSVGDTVSTSSDGTIDLQGGTLQGGLNMAGDSQWLLNAGTITGCGTIAGNFINAGTINIDCPTLEESIAPIRFVNRGRITVSRGYLHAASSTGSIRNIGVIDGGNGGILIDHGATIQNTGGLLLAGRSNVTLAGRATTATIVGGTLGSSNGGYFANAGQTTLQDATLGAGSTFYTMNRGVTTAAGASLVNRGTIAVQTGGAFVAGGSTDYVMQDGVTLMQGGTLTVPRGLLVQGALEGTGTVVGKVVNAGVISPDAAAGLSIQGDYVQSRIGTLSMGVGGYTPELISHLGVSGAATLDGKVTMTPTGGFAPQVGHTFNVMAFGSRTGQFSVVDAAPGLEISALYDDASLSLQTTAPAGVGGPSLPQALRFYGRGLGFALELPQTAEVTVNAYDVTGRRVAVLANGVLPAGVHGLELSGRGLANGVYFARASLRIGNQASVREARVIVIR